MSELQRLFEHTLQSNPAEAWIEAAIIFAVWFTVLPLLKMAITRRLKALKPEQSSAGLEFALALLRGTKRVFTVAVAAWLALRALDLHNRIERWTDGAILVVFWWQVALWGTTAVRFLVAQREARDARTGEGRGPSFAILRFVGTVFVWTITLLMLLANLGVNITAMVTGLGIGGVAVALAVQNILGDLFASLSIALDKPFQVGDAIQIDDIVGTVENVGIKSTRIRSVGGEQVVISNAQLLAARLRNFGRAEERRAFYTIGVTYETPPEKLRRIPGIVAGIVGSLPGTRFERCHFRSFGDSALLYEVAFYSLDGGLMPLVELQQEFNLRLIEAFREQGIEFAYPTMKQFTVEVPR